MIFLRRPDRAAIDAMLREADSRSRGAAPFGYAEVGATRRPETFAALADRYTLDRRRFVLGQGQALFEAAREALFAWRHFEIPWLALEGRDRLVEEGQAVATSTRVFGIGFLSPCRVVYREDPAPSSGEVAFAYGTLAGHVAAGEERFTLRFAPESGSVEFEIFAFSRPAILLSRVGRPFMRRIQRRFAGDAAAALARACGGLSTGARELGTG